MVVTERIIVCRLDINDVNDQFCPDYSKMRMEKIKKQLVGYCFRAMLITSIEEIIAFSQIRTNSKELSGNMHMDIEARVKGIIYEAGEIISDVMINNVTNTILSASSKYANVNIVIGNLNILKVGDMTPVIVRLSQYNISSTKISIAAEPFVPKFFNTIKFYVCDEYTENKLTNKLKKEANNYLNTIREFTPEKKQSMEFFVNLVYPYKKKRTFSSVQLFNSGDENKTNAKHNCKINSASLLSASPKNVIMFKGYSSLNDDNIYIIEENKIILDFIKITDGTSNNSKINLFGKFNDGETYKLVICKNNSADVLSLFLKQYIVNLNTLINLVETYPDKKTLLKSNHVWNYYNLNKK